ncbi:MAG: phage antirepressor N-terminal domain-containing protein [Roseiflexaceae bacterium]
MSDASERLPRPRAKVQEIPFEEDRLIAVILEGEGIAVPVREICRTLGLDIDTQSARLREHEVLSQGLRVVRIRYGDRIRSVVAILHKYIPFWMATITPGLVAEHVRPKLVRYQIELVDLLAAIYGGEQQGALPAPADTMTTALQQRLVDAITEVRLAREALLAAQQEVREQIDSHEIRLTTAEGLMDELQAQIASHTTITAAQREVIQRAIKRIAVRYEQRTGKDVFGLLFSQFCVDLGTPKYGLLPAGKYDAALDWLRQKAAEYLPNDPDALPPLQEALL